MVVIFRSDFRRERDSGDRYDKHPERNNILAARFGDDMVRRLRAIGIGTNGKDDRTSFTTSSGSCSRIGDWMRADRSEERLLVCIFVTLKASLWDIDKLDVYIFVDGKVPICKMLDSGSVQFFRPSDLNQSPKCTGAVGAYVGLKSRT
jgi:hypothetical protein